MSDELLKQVIGEIKTLRNEVSSRMDALDLKLDRIESKLDATFEQVGKNTEHDSTFNELAVTVDSHTTDIKLLKKLVANR
ncbi:hypothetical protein [Cohnella herbarum]|uniref:Uncharacterized protein n=1 Tax=Cohnella herbarum TaxID=2728023 RepID=A0A7Z2VFF8_9BACL|nr:hypothetical protein [Cohnella herbarum]QJD82066.1 hypothetical protein HH215_01975 [Cohnella herbarum]